MTRSKTIITWAPPVQALDMTDEEVAERTAGADLMPGCQKYHAYEYVGYSEKVVGYHQWTCSACGDTSIRGCTVAHGGHARCQACEVVGYAYLPG